jgi:hypothetical protein
MSVFRSFAITALASALAWSRALAQAPTDLPADLCDFRFAVTEQRVLPELALGATRPGVPATLRAPAGSHILVVMLRGLAHSDGTLVLSSADVAGYLPRGVSAARAIAFSQAGDSLRWTAGRFGDVVTVHRTVRAGPVTLAAAFVVPHDVTGIEVALPTRIPAHRPLAPVQR